MMNTHRRDNLVSPRAAETIPATITDMAYSIHQILILKSAIMFGLLVIAEIENSDSGISSLYE